MTPPVSPNRDPLRLRARLRVVDGRLTWDCPHCDHGRVTDPPNRHSFVLTRIRHHLRYRHGYLGIHDFRPAKPPKPAAAVPLLGLLGRTSGQRATGPRTPPQPPLAA